MPCPALPSLNASKCRQTIRRLRNELACYDIDVNAIQSLAMYMQNSQVIEPLLTLGVSQVRFQATSDEKLRSASELLHGIVSNLA